MAKSTGITVKVHIDGARETVAAFRRLPKEANDELRNASGRIAQAMTGRIRAAARAEGRQAALVAGTVKVSRDRLPAVQAGGTRRVGRKRAPAYTLLFASEFGMSRRSGWYASARYRASTGRQYKRHLGRGSYWFFASVKAQEATIAGEWNRCADAIIRAFSKGGE